MTPGNAVQARTDLLWNEVDGETVVLDPSRKRYFGIEGVGVAIWRQLQSRTTEPQILRKVLDEFDVEEETLRRHLRSFLEQLSDADLLAPT